ncbi:hypothetical protein L0F63_005327 [Massospora cicadina]|nr:hypothetical protein L0F63_005327 [Massospora cicadina]
MKGRQPSPSQIKAPVKVSPDSASIPNQRLLSPPVGSSRGSSEDEFVVLSENLESGSSQGSSKLTLESGAGQAPTELLAAPEILELGNHPDASAQAHQPMEADNANMLVSQDVSANDSPVDTPAQSSANLPPNDDQTDSLRSSPTSLGQPIKAIEDSNLPSSMIDSSASHFPFSQGEDSDVATSNLSSTELTTKLAEEAGDDQPKLSEELADEPATPSIFLQSQAPRSPVDNSFTMDGGFDPSHPPDVTPQLQGPSQTSALHAAHSPAPNISHSSLQQFEDKVIKVTPTVLFSHLESTANVSVTRLSHDFLSSPDDQAESCSKASQVVEPTHEMSTDVVFKETVSGDSATSSEDLNRMVIAQEKALINNTGNLITEGSDMVQPTTPSISVHDERVSPVANEAKDSNGSGIALEESKSLDGSFDMCSSDNRADIAAQPVTCEGSRNTSEATEGAHEPSYTPEPVMKPKLGLAYCEEPDAGSCLPTESIAFDSAEIASAQTLSEPTGSTVPSDVNTIEVGSCTQAESAASTPSPLDPASVEASAELSKVGSTLESEPINSMDLDSPRKLSKDSIPVDLLSNEVVSADVQEATTTIMVGDEQVLVNNMEDTFVTPKVPEDSEDVRVACDEHYSDNMELPSQVASTTTISDGSKASGQQVEPAQLASSPSEPSLKPEEHIVEDLTAIQCMVREASDSAEGSGAKSSLEPSVSMVSIEGRPLAEDAVQDKAIEAHQIPVNSTDAYDQPEGDFAPLLGALPASESISTVSSEMSPSVQDVVHREVAEATEVPLDSSSGHDHLKGNLVSVEPEVLPTSQPVSPVLCETSPPVQDVHREVVDTEISIDSYNAHDHLKDNPISGERDVLPALQSIPTVTSAPSPVKDDQREVPEDTQLPVDSFSDYELLELDHSLAELDALPAFESVPVVGSVNDVAQHEAREDTQLPIDSSGSYSHLEDNLALAEPEALEPIGLEQPENPFDISSVPAALELQQALASVSGVRDLLSVQVPASSTENGTKLPASLKSVDDGGSSSVEESAAQLDTRVETKAALSSDEAEAGFNNVPVPTSSDSASNLQCDKASRPPDAGNVDLEAASFKELPLSIVAEAVEVKEAAPVSNQKDEHNLDTASKVSTVKCDAVDTLPEVTATDENITGDNLPSGPLKCKEANDLSKPTEALDYASSSDLIGRVSRSDRAFISAATGQPTRTFGWMHTSGPKSNPSVQKPIRFKDLNRITSPAPPAGNVKGITSPAPSAGSVDAFMKNAMEPFSNAVGLEGSFTSTQVDNAVGEPSLPRKIKPNQPQTEKHTRTPLLLDEPESQLLGQKLRQVSIALGLKDEVAQTSRLETEVTAQPSTSSEPLKEDVEQLLDQKSIPDGKAQDLEEEEVNQTGLIKAEVAVQPSIPAEPLKREVEQSLVQEAISQALTDDNVQLSIRDADISKVGLEATSKHVLPKDANDKVLPEGVVQPCQLDVEPVSQTIATPLKDDYALQPNEVGLALESPFKPMDFSQTSSEQTLRPNQTDFNSSAVQNLPQVDNSHLTEESDNLELTKLGETMSSGNSQSIADVIASSSNLLNETELNSQLDAKPESGPLEQTPKPSHAETADEVSDALPFQPISGPAENITQPPSDSSEDLSLPSSVPTENVTPPTSESAEGITPLSSDSIEDIIPPSNRQTTPSDGCELPFNFDPELGCFREDGVELGWESLPLDPKLQTSFHRQDEQRRVEAFYRRKLESWRLGVGKVAGEVYQYVAKAFATEHQLAKHDLKLVALMNELAEIPLIYAATEKLLGWVESELARLEASVDHLTAKFTQLQNHRLPGDLKATMEAYYESVHCLARVSNNLAQLQEQIIESVALGSERFDDLPQLTSEEATLKEYNLQLNGLANKLITSIVSPRYAHRTTLGWAYIVDMRDPSQAPPNPHPKRG